MIENRNVNIITDADGKKLVLINDIRFKGKRQIDWDDVKQYLEGYVGDYYEIAENAEHILPSPSMTKMWLSDTISSMPVF